MTDSIIHKMALDSIGFAAQILTPQADYYREFVEAERAMHSSLHITDPTLYIKAINSDSLRMQVELAKAALAFVAAVQLIAAELEVKSDG